MNNIIYSFVITSLAGLSTLLGYLVIFFKGNPKKIITLALSFASGVMLTISIIDLIPSSFSYFFKYHFIFRVLLISFFFVLGLFFSTYINNQVEKKEHNSLKKIGIMSVVVIIFHNIPEGIITFMVSGVDISLGLKLALSISLHNIPEGISISVPLYYSTKKKICTFFLVFIAGFSEILGAILCYFFLKDLVNDFLIGCIFSLIAGIMTNISITELLPESFHCQEKKLSSIGFIFGSLIMIISHILL